jgi:hypothetical protein
LPWTGSPAGTSSARAAVYPPVANATNAIVANAEPVVNCLIFIFRIPITVDP